MKAGLDRRLVTTALILGMVLAAIEVTAVGTAMPTAIAELGGVTRYSWVFSIYLLTSTTTVPLYGKLADLYGRRVIYIISAGLFMLGSALCGLAQSMDQLIFFRAIQGIGAGGVMPVAVTIVGDIYSLRERGKVQGAFSGVWAVSSLMGPAIGGIVTDELSWRWIFYLNIPFGIASVVMLVAYLREEPVHREHKLDILGTLALTACVTLLLVGLLEGSDAWGWSDPRTISALIASVITFIVFIWQEKRASEPTVPLELFRNPVISIASIGSVIIGILVFATSAYVPMYAQGVLGGSAIDAGAVLMPMSLAWPFASALAGWLVMRTGYRILAIFGALFSAAGVLLLAVDADSATRTQLIVAMAIMGFGLGMAANPYLLSVQSAVPQRMRGVVSSSNQFFRTIGGCIGIAALGALLNARLHTIAGPDVDANGAMDPALRASLGPAELDRLVSGLAGALGAVYWGLVILAAFGVIVALFFPRGSAASHAHVEGAADAGR